VCSSAAQNVETLIAANVCNGIAAAGQLSFGIVLGELVPNKWRGPIVTLVFASSLPFAGMEFLFLSSSCFGSFESCFFSWDMK